MFIFQLSLVGPGGLRGLIVVLIANPAAGIVIPSWLGADSGSLGHYGERSRTVASPEDTDQGMSCVA